MPTTGYRTTFIDPDYRRDPKTDWYCVRCQKDLKPGQPHRFIAFELDHGEAAIHADDWDTARDAITSERTMGAEAFIVGPVGMECAGKIGVEFTRASP
jgi:hypothetical protein